MDYAVPSIGREFGSVFLGDKNVSLMVVADGWAKVYITFAFVTTFEQSILFLYVGIS